MLSESIYNQSKHSSYSQPEPKPKSRRKRTAQPQNAHARKRRNKAQSPRMRQIQTLAQQLQAHHGHNPRRDSKHAPIHDIAGLAFALALSTSCDLEPQGRDAGAQRLADAAEQGAPEHCFPAGPNGEVEGQRHGEALGDVVDEEGEEDGEAQRGVGVVGCVGYEAFGDFVQGDCGAGLEADREENVGWHVVVVLGGRGVAVRVSVGVRVGMRGAV